jgi:hypothetical protein
MKLNPRRDLWRETAELRNFISLLELSFESGKFQKRLYL